MTRKFILGLILLLSIGAFAQVKTESTIEHVTIFSSGAEIERTAKATVEAGSSVIWLMNVDRRIDPNSIRISGKGDFYITNYQWQSQYIEKETSKADNDLLVKYERELKRYEDSLREVQYEIQDLTEKQRIIQREKHLLENNPIATGQAIGDSLELLIEAVDYFREQLNEVNEIGLELQRNLYDVNLVRDRLNRRINELRNLIGQIKPGNQNNVEEQYIIAVSVQSQKAQSIQLDFSYFAYDAGWNVQYEINAMQKGKPIELVTRAQVWQRTHSDWTNVKVSLSTGQPTVDISLPVLQPWYLSLVQPNRTHGDRSAPKSYEESEVLDAVVIESDDVPQQNAFSSAQATTTAQNFQYLHYDIDLRYDIANDGQGTLIDLKEDQVNANYEHLLFPSREQFAFLTARVGNLANYIELPGQAKLYMNNTYLGNLFLDPMVMPDSMDISLGRDKRIRIERTMVKENTKNELIGSDQRIDREIQYRITNGYNTRMTVKVKEVLPQSRDGRIEVKVLDETQFDYTIDELKGFIEWPVDIAPNGEVNQKAFIRVTYPKGERLYGF
jgi:uncharacterized protein (TIGR02231 family)